MVPLFIFDLFDPNAFVFVDHGMPMAAIGVSCRALGRVGKLQERDQMLFAVVVSHKRNLLRRKFVVNCYCDLDELPG